ncbi:LPS export ABC transporter periplasmic protein LptC [Roseomonas chloroacetimidivorans]|uniref:LPS export ABC transporter periplasmic protein LptC n=1 Tax=Roseomonas chloroacetimidivorans TaxID=1766656 RepID=UPI003C7291D0
MTVRASFPPDAEPNAGPQEREAAGEARADGVPEDGASVRGAVPLAAVDQWHERPVPSRARRNYSHGSILRRRVMVQLLKYLLPAGALALLAAIVLWPEIDRNTENARLSFRRLSRLTPEAVRVVDPRYQGVDEQGRPYNVTAFLATQPGQANIVDLDTPRGDMTQANGGWALVESRNGRFDREAGILELWTDVTVWQDDGTLIETQEARVDVKGGNAEGDRPVAAQGSFGTVAGEGFRLRDRGAVVVFTGNARAVLEGGK